MSSRRDFMAQCLGGLGVAIVDGVPEIAKRAEASKLIDIKIEGFDKGPEPGTESLWTPPNNHFRVFTNYNPNDTKILAADNRPIKFIDELLVQWSPGNVMPWVGFGFISLPADHIKDDDACLPQIEWGKPNLNHDVLPVLKTQHGNGMPFQLAKVEHDGLSMISRGFAIGRMLVEIVDPPRVQFMRCSNCNYYDRCIDFKQNGWEMNTAQRPCPSCGTEGRQQVDLDQELLPWKLHMTPTTSILVCQDVQEGDKRPTVALWPEDLDLSNRPMWMTKEAKSHPVAQLVPEPSPLNEIFLSTFAPLFGGVVR